MDLRASWEALATEVEEFRPLAAGASTMGIQLGMTPQIWSSTRHDWSPKYLGPVVDNGMPESTIPELHAR